MNYTEFLNYKEQSCRFRLKSGKEVYGVIWARPVNDRFEYYFASASAYKKVESTNDPALHEKAACRLSLEDILMAEPIKE